VAALKRTADGLSKYIGNKIFLNKTSSQLKTTNLIIFLKNGTIALKKLCSLRKNSEYIFKSLII